MPPMKAPMELKAWLRLRRKCEPSGLPMAEISGLAATWSRVMPEAATNRPSKTVTKVCEKLVDQAIRQPAMMPTNPRMIELA